MLDGVVALNGCLVGCSGFHSPSSGYMFLDLDKETINFGEMFKDLHDFGRFKSSSIEGFWVAPCCPTFEDKDLDFHQS